MTPTPPAAAAPSAHVQHTNRLAQEKSPYLLQHAHNPVDWYPWGEEAFAKARREKKPIFLSIGYSTCHWCHVMERESFENEEVASLMNSRFREHQSRSRGTPGCRSRLHDVRPGDDRQRRLAAECLADPGLKPFVGGTYFPPEDRHGQPSFMKVFASDRGRVGQRSRQDQRERRPNYGGAGSPPPPRWRRARGKLTPG